MDGKVPLRKGDLGPLHRWCHLLVPSVVGEALGCPELLWLQPTGGLLSTVASPPWTFWPHCISGQSAHVLCGLLSPAMPLSSWHASAGPVHAQNFCWTLLPVLCAEASYTSMALLCAPLPACFMPSHAGTRQFLQGLLLPAEQRLLMCSYCRCRCLTAT